MGNASNRKNGKNYEGVHMSLKDYENLMDENKRLNMSLEGYEKLMGENKCLKKTLAAREKIEPPALSRVKRLMINAINSMEIPDWQSIANDEVEPLKCVDEANDWINSPAIKEKLKQRWDISEERWQSINEERKKEKQKARMATLEVMKLDEGELEKMRNEIERQWADLTAWKTKADKVLNTILRSNEEMQGESAEASANITILQERLDKLEARGFWARLFNL